MYFGRVPNKTGSPKMWNYLSAHVFHEMQQDIKARGFSSLKYKMHKKKNLWKVIDVV